MGQNDIRIIGTLGLKVHIVKSEAQYGSVTMCGRFMGGGNYSIVPNMLEPTCKTCIKKVLNT